MHEVKAGCQVPHSFQNILAPKKMRTFPAARSGGAFIVARMSNSPVPFGLDRSLLRLDDLYLCLHFAMIFVRDQERSLRFYLGQLGFRLVVDIVFETGGRWIEVAPPDGSASIALALAPPDSEA
jgi:Glyoxalase/Bleomycin resistance protein/Dioxygenase superfamily